jgi:hypothetical protein
MGIFFGLIGEKGATRLRRAGVAIDPYVVVVLQSARSPMIFLPRDSALVISVYKYNVSSTARRPNVSDATRE